MNLDRTKRIEPNIISLKIKEQVIGAIEDTKKGTLIKKIRA